MECLCKAWTDLCTFYFSLSSVIIMLDLLRIEVMAPTIYAKNPQAISIVQIPYTRSGIIAGVMSPYPTVAIVVNE